MYSATHPRDSWSHGHPASLIGGRYAEAGISVATDSRAGPFQGHSGHESGVRLAVAVIATAYLGYLALLFTCDLLLIAPFGFVPSFKASGVIVEQLESGSVGARAGLLPGDRLDRANEQVLKGRADWERVRTRLDPARPLVLEITRNNRPLVVNLPLRSGPAEWTLKQRPALLAFRAAQAVTLIFALVVAFRRYAQPSALLGAVLLGSVATVSLALPTRFAALWDGVPPVFAALLWIPFATSVAVGPLLFVFFAVFPRRVWSAATVGVALVPAALVVSWHVYSWHRIMQKPGPPTGISDWLMGVFAMNVIYATCAIALLVLHKHTVQSLTDQRRVRVLIAGGVIGIGAGASVVVGHWRNPGADIFASRGLAVLSLMFLAVPASFAYAILRHRLFDVSLIVRQGLQYALARRFVDALIPLLAGALLIDVIAHRAQALPTLIRARWLWFTCLGAALLFARTYREQWLNAIDRHFFRERYDAQRLLHSIAEEITRASSCEAIAPAVVQRIDEALHPEFVSVFRYVPNESQYAGVDSGAVFGFPTSRTLPPLPASLAVIGVLSVLRKPLALSLGDTAWVRHQLPIAERALLIDQGIELLVPICRRLPGDPLLGLLVLGARRSEEPYSPEDLDLLVTIAHAVGQLLQRSSDVAQMLAECETCGRCFDAGISACPLDGGRLCLMPGTRLLDGRYRLERRLGRGGMGAVYEAMDIVLERAVAVKLIREDIVGPLDLARRFREEARTVARFAHPHVVSIYDFAVDRHQRPFLVMELLDGDTLRQRLASGIPLSAHETLHILRGVCAAVGAAHSRGLVHRDLKPENIFLQRHPSGVVPKVLDFGLAKAFNPQFSPERITHSSAGLLVGTLDYMSPEQAAGDDVSPSWDVWAISVIAYEMLTASHPFRRTIAFDSDAAGQDATTVHQPHTPGLSDAGAAFFRAALSPERALRPSEAVVFLETCERALS